MEMKKETEKAGLKLNVKKTKIMASGPITSGWGNYGNAAMKLKNACSVEEKL